MTEEAIDAMTRDQKIAAGFSPMRCARCHGRRHLWDEGAQAAIDCPQCQGAGFVWIEGLSAAARLL